MTQTMRPRSWWAAGLLLVLTLVLSATPATAHTDPIESSTPRHGSVVTEVDEIAITFTGSIRPDFATFTLRSADGRDHAMTEPVFADGDTEVRWSPELELPDGLYRIGYQIVFDDGHSSAGVVQFEISADGTARAGNWPADDDTAPTRPEPERLDVSGLVGWIVGGAALLVAVFVVIMVRVRSANGGPGPDDSSDPDDSSSST